MSDWYFIDTAEYRRHGEQLQAERRAAEQTREAEAEKLFRAEEAAAQRRIRNGDTGGYWQHFKAWANRHRINVNLNADRAYANWRTRTAYLPGQPRTEEDAADAYHEGAHILAGECPGKEPHRRSVCGAMASLHRL